MRQQLNHKQGFTLLEVIIFITIFTLFFITVASITVSSLHSLRVNEHKLLATRYSEELLEWLQGEKEADWNAFYDHASDLSYSGCRVFNLSTLDWNTTANCTGQIDPGLNPPIFTREAHFTINAPSEITVEVTTNWNDDAGQYNVSLKSVLAVEN